MKKDKQQKQIEYKTGGGVVVDHGRVLLLERPSRQEIRLPKGHIEIGETPENAGLRETAEESGYCDLQIEHDLGHRLVEFDYENDHYRRTEYYFLMRLLSKRKQPRPPEDEVGFNILWLPMALALEALTYPAEQDVLQRAIDYLTQEM